MAGEAGQLTGAERAYALERIRSARPFASQLVPGHLAVLLATSLPLAVGAALTARRRPLWWLVVGLAIAGLVSTRSPLGLGLAAAAVVFGRLRSRRRRVVLAVVGLLALAVLATLWLRPDVARLEPLRLRFDNWRAAVWVWSTAPASGAGFGSFGQASQTAPIDLGNRPAHAHGLPFEALAELGPVGLATVLALLVGIGVTAWRLREDDPWLAAGIMVVPAHNLADFSLWTTGAAIPWAVLFGWALARTARAPDGPPAPRRDPARTAMILVASLAAGVSLLHATSRLLEWSVTPADPALRRLAIMQRSAAVAPWRLRPALKTAIAALEIGDVEACRLASDRLDRLAWLRPRSADVASIRARLDAAIGDLAGAEANAWAARNNRIAGRLDTIDGRASDDAMR